MSITSQPTKKGGGRSVAIIIVAVVIVVAAVAGYYFISTSGSSPTSTTQSAGVDVTIPAGTASSGTLNFTPQTITVVVGMNNTITFVNDDSALHTVTFTNVPTGVQSSQISDSNLGAGKSFTVQLTTLGTYQYHCTIHSWMQGTVIVKSA